MKGFIRLRYFTGKLPIYIYGKYGFSMDLVIIFVLLYHNSRIINNVLMGGMFRLYQVIYKILLLF